MLAAGLDTLGIGRQELLAMPKGEPQKTVPAWWWLRERTTVSLRRVGGKAGGWAITRG